MPFDNHSGQLIAQYDWQLRQPLFYVERIWRPAVVERLSRRNWVDALSLIYDYADAITWPEGTRFPVPDIDKVFHYENRWMTNFLSADSTGVAPESFCRVNKRLRLIALFNDIRRTQLVG